MPVHINKKKNLLLCLPHTLALVFNVSNQTDHETLHVGWPSVLDVISTTDSIKPSAISFSPGPLMLQHEFLGNLGQLVQ